MTRRSNVKPCNGSLKRRLSLRVGGSTSYSPMSKPCGRFVLVLANLMLRSVSQLDQLNPQPLLTCQYIACSRRCDDAMPWPHDQWSHPLPISGLRESLPCLTPILDIFLLRYRHISKLYHNNRIMSGIFPLYHSETYFEPDALPYSKQDMMPQNCKFGIVGSNSAALMSEVAFIANFSPAQYGGSVFILG